MTSALLSSVISPSTRSRESLVVIQSTLATRWLPLLHAILDANSAAAVCVCLLHPPNSLLPTGFIERGNNHLKVIDWTDNVPGYVEEQQAGDGEKLLNAVHNAVDEAPDGPVLLIVDSPDTLCEDIGSSSRAHNILKSWYEAVAKRPAPSRLLLPLPSRSSLLPLLITPAFAPSIARVILHPPALLLHLFSDYLTLPPPHSPPSKFWPIFFGLAARGEAERLVWGTDGGGWGEETVVEVIVRNASGRNTVDRSLEGWRRAGTCELKELEGLRPLWVKGATTHQQNQQATADPTHNLPFNLNLTEAQQLSRAQVPLPYAHEGQPSTGGSNTGAIFYDPDSADDIDDDDPDEDLDI